MRNWQLFHIASLKATYKDCFPSLISLWSTPEWISCNCSVIKSDSCLRSSGDKSALIGHEECYDTRLITSTDLFNSCTIDTFDLPDMFAWSPFSCIAAIQYVTLPSGKQKAVQAKNLCWKHLYIYREVYSRIDCGF